MAPGQYAGHGEGRPRHLAAVSKLRSRMFETAKTSDRIVTGLPMQCSDASRRQCLIRGRLPDEKLMSVGALLVDASSRLSGQKGRFWVAPAWWGRTDTTLKGRVSLSCSVTET